ncbi:Flagellar hook protein FlgE [Botrimarina colliarenosi]|uniref:Flagellar hook protein FlgE n=1 Tax=Botrimarina colliarenosi TaxID=2528001 RepID=A0A5C6AJV0_9BACT|nr:flagellar hook-basal body complex protein [Botrimarina colliarenosi]TWU00325.1 Flagellar hook protein FlgE [Botrimarina colliarenosi]
MGLQSSMTTALTGLQAAETTIDVIGNNVANSNTVGFKASDVIFATQFLQTQSIGSAPSDRNGGTNPRQIGLGVKVAEISPNFGQGTIEISSNPLDLAIQGDGFLMVQGSQGEQLYTRNGQLGLNSSNQVVTANGNKLLGYAVNERYELQTASPVPIEIPLGGQRVAQATTEANFQGVLNPTVVPGTVPAITESEFIGDASVAYPNGIITTGAGTGADPFVSTDYFTADDLEIRVPPNPATATSSTPGSPTGLSAGTYRYRVTFVDDNGQESTASTIFSPAGPIALGDQIDLTGLPDLSGNPGNPWSSMNIYRTEADGSEFKYVGNVLTGTTTFADTVADASLTASLDTDTLENGSYTYYITYANPANGNESRPSLALGPLAVTDDDSGVRLDLSDLQLPTDPNYSRLKIYRNATGDSSTFYEVDDLPLPTPGNDSYVDKTPSADITGNDQLNFDGVGAAGGTLLSDLQVRNGNTYSTPFAELGTLRFVGEVGGSLLDSQTLEITATTTVQNLVDFMSDALGLQVQSNVNGSPLPLGGGTVSIANGVISVTSNFGEENTVSIPLTGFRLTPAGAVAPQTIDLTFSESQDANGPGTSTEFLVYDSLGSPLTVRMTTVLEKADSNSTTYRWYATSGDSNPAAPELTTAIGNGLMVFDSRGNLISSPSARISIARELTAGESPLEISLDFSQVTSLAETDSSGNAVSSFNMVRQDGFPPGVLTDFIITDSGLIQGQFSNGTQRLLGQVLMARFANNKGLRQIGSSLYAVSVNSGDPFVSTPGEDGIGSLTAGAVELSNTDIGQDLVKMILAQTQYQAGSRVISTAQQLLDELLALNR